MRFPPLFLQSSPLPSLQPSNSVGGNEAGYIGCMQRFHLNSLHHRLHATTTETAGLAPCLLSSSERKEKAT